MDTSILLVATAYVLGSIPFGYIISFFSTKKNVLEVGWEKTSGSNVFINIGKWQGVLTGLLDIGKGFFAVWLAQKFNSTTEIQALAGVAAIAGHNWSCFLRFAGGRGIATFVGAALALAPKILLFSLIPTLLLALIWNTSIGTILLLIVFTSLSLHFNNIEIALFFGVLSLFPIFIKRLSPIKDIVKPGPLKIKESGKIIDKVNFIRNRLIYDDSIPYLEFRIKRIIRRFTKP